MWISRKTSRKSALRWSVTPESEPSTPRSSASATPRASGSAARAAELGSGAAAGMLGSSAAAFFCAERVNATMAEQARSKMDPKSPRRLPRPSGSSVSQRLCVLVPPACLSGMLGRRARLEQAQARSGAFETEYAATYREDDLARSRRDDARAGESLWPNFVDAIHGFARFDRVGQGEKLCAGGGGTGRLGVDELRALGAAFGLSHDAASCTTS